MSKYSLRPIHKPGKELKDFYKIFVPSKLYISLRTNTKEFWNLEDENGKVVATGRLSPAQDEVQNRVLQVTHEFKDLFELTFTDNYNLRRSETSIRNATEVVLVEDHSQDDLLSRSRDARQFWTGFLTQYLSDKLVSPGLYTEELETEGQKRSFRINTVSSSSLTYGLDAPLEVHAVPRTCHVRLEPSSETSYGSTDFKIKRDGIFGLDAELTQIDQVLKFHDPTHKRPTPVTCTGLLIVGSPGTGKTLISSRVAQLPWARTVNLSKADFRKNSLATLPRLFEECSQSEPCLIILSDLDGCLSESGESPEHTTIAAFRRIRNRKIMVIAETEASTLSPSLSRCFQRTIVLTPPDENARRDLLLHALDFYNVTVLAAPEIATIMSQRTPGYTGCDMEDLVDQAILFAQSRDIIEQETLGTDQDSKVDPLNVILDDLEQARLANQLSKLKNGLVHREVRWADIGGQEEIKRTVEMLFEWPLKYPQRFKALGIQPGKGLLLYGPPGCSKTMTALALATEAKLNFIPIQGPELLNQYVGKSEQNLRDTFSKARSMAPCVIFFDEIDSIGSSRGNTSGESQGGVNLITTFLNEMDGVFPSKGVSVLAATNKPWELDQALLRAGRFNKLVYVKLPDEQARRQILQLKLNDMSHDPTIDMEKLVQETDGCSGAEVVDLCRDAAEEALQAQLHLPETRVEAIHFEKALRQLRRDTPVELVARYEAFASRSRRG